MEDIIKLSLEDYPKFVNDDDPELAIAQALYLSTRPNSHGFILSEEVLKEYASTILGKFLVGNLNIFETDVMSHEKQPDIFGYIPKEQSVVFKRADDGYLDAYVNIVVSKIYATKVYNLFLEDNFRNVSVEMRVMYENEESKKVVKFNIAGLTVLAKNVNPSVPQAHMEMVRFSAEQAQEYYVKMASSNNFETEVLSKLNSICDKLNLKETVNNETKTEEYMAKKLEEKEKDIVMEQPTEEKVSEEEKKEEKLSEENTEDADKDTEEKKEEEEKSSDEEKSVEDSKEKEEKASEEDSKEDDKEDDKEDEEDAKKLADKEAECAELNKKCEKLEVKCANLESELADLVKFKAETEEKEKMAIVNQTLAQVKDSMESDCYAKFEESAKEQSLDTINAWRNEVLANVATVLMSKNKDNNETHLRMNVEDVKKESTSVWDRM